MKQMIKLSKKKLVKAFQINFVPPFKKMIEQFPANTEFDVKGSIISLKDKPLKK